MRILKWIGFDRTHLVCPERYIALRPLPIYLLFFASGCTGLIYEVIWMRSMRLVLGSSVEAASTVLAAFLGGLGLGSLLGARLSRRGNPLKRYAVAELIVAASALAVPLWLYLYHLSYPTLYDWLGSSPAALRACRLLMALLAMAVPTIAMGTTLPLVTRATVVSMDHFAWHTGLLYAINTFGATCGALVAGFYLPITLGINDSVFLAAGLNAIVGVIAWTIAGPSPTAPSATIIAPPRRIEPTLLVLAALSGFGSLALEVVYFRILSFSSEGSVYSFSLMLVFALTFLASAAVWVARSLDHQNVWRFLAWTQLAAVLVLLLTPLIFLGLPYFAGYTPEDTFVERMTRYAITSAAILGPSMLLIGVVLPCTWKLAASELDESGRTVGVLTGVNTLAAVCGSLVAGFALLPRFGLGLAALSVAVVYGCVGAIAFWRAYRGVFRWAGGAISLAMIAVWFIFGGWQLQMLAQEEGFKLVSYHDGADATVVVVERADGHRTLKVNHDYTLGSSAGADREVRQGRIPLILHPDPRRVAFIGVATGMTVSAALDFPVERVAAVELLPGVADTLPLFAEWNGNVGEDKRVEIVVEDGRNFLAGTSEQFDVIIGDLFVPWQAGTGDLYSVEHFAAVRERLAPGGIFGQCLPGYQLSLEELRSIAASMLEVFPNTMLWRNDFNIDYPILSLIAYRDEPTFDAAATERHAQRVRETTGTPDRILERPADLPLLFVCGPRELADWARGAPLNTDDHPLIEFGAPKSYLVHRQRNVEPINSFLSSMRPRTWPFQERPSERPMEQLFQVADLINDSQIAFDQNNFEREFRKTLELAQLAGDMPVVSGYVMAVASRYRGRQMGERSRELLSALAKFPEPPVVALGALAKEYQIEGEIDEAVSLLEKIVDERPENPAPRKALVELLQQDSDYARAESHLRELIKIIPDDPFLRLDLVHALHTQHKTAEAQQAMNDFIDAWDGEKSAEVWRYLRTKGLGAYVDRPGRQEPNP